MGVAEPMREKLVPFRPKWYEGPGNMFPRERERASQVSYGSGLALRAPRDNSKDPSEGAYGVISSSMRYMP